MTAFGETSPQQPLLRVVGDSERAAVDFPEDGPPNFDHLPDSVLPDFTAAAAFIENLSEIEILRLRLAVVTEDRERLSADLDHARDELDRLHVAAMEIRHLLPERTRDFWEASRILRAIAGVLDRTRRPSW